jgi:predicted nucleotidyltransferase
VLFRNEEAADLEVLLSPAGDARPIDSLLQRVAEWASSRPDIRAVALIGSYARGTPGVQSDVDFVVLTTCPEEYVDRDEWIIRLDVGKLVDTKLWGEITERRLRRPDGLELDIGIGRPSWASVDPVDPGTRRVVTDGIQIVYDPDGLLRDLIAACL